MAATVVGDFDAFAAQQLHDGYAHDPSCVRMIQMSMAGAASDAFDAQGARGFFDLGSDIMLWKCRGGTLLGYTLFRLVVVAVLAVAVYTLLAPALKRHASVALERMRDAYDHPCVGDMHACRVPSGETCFRASATSVRRCTYYTRAVAEAGAGAAEPHVHAAEVPDATAFEAFLDEHYPATPAWKVGLVSVAAAAILGALVNWIWRWYAKSQVMRAKALGTEALARAML